MSTAARMIALDIDGTLTEVGRSDVPEPTARAVAAARDAGHHIVLATGRSLVAVLPIIRSLNLTSGWMVASNGAVVARLAPDAPGGYLVETAPELDVERESAACST